MLEKISQTQGVTRRFFVSIPYESMGGFHKTPTFTEIKSTLNKQARSVQSSLESCGNALVSSDDRDYVLSALYTAACKAQSDVIPWEERKAYVLQRYQNEFGENVNEKRIPAADFIAPERIDSSFSPNYMIIDGKYVAHCFLPSNAYPVQAYAGWLQVLFAYMDDVYVDFWIHKEPVQSIQPKLRFALKNNKIKAKNTDDISQDYEDIEASVSAGYYIKQALSNGDEFCYISTMLTIFADTLDELKDRYREMSNYCIRNDMNMRYCTAQQDDAFLSSLPCMPLDKGIFAKSKRNIMASVSNHFLYYDGDSHDAFCLNPYLSGGNNYTEGTFNGEWYAADYEAALKYIRSPENLDLTYSSYLRDPHYKRLDDYIFESLLHKQRAN